LGNLHLHFFQRPDHEESKKFSASITRPSVCPEIVALVPWRGWVKADTRQNISPSQEAAGILGLLCRQELPVYQRCYVSTENEEIARTIESFRPVFRFLARPKSLATDVSTTEDVILPFQDLGGFDIVAKMRSRPPRPLVSITDLDLAMEQFLREGSDSLFTGVQVRRFFWSIDGRPYKLYDPFHRPFTPEFQGSIMENGAFYLTRRHILET